MSLVGVLFSLSRTSLVVVALSSPEIPFGAPAARVYSSLFLSMSTVEGATRDLSSIRSAMWYVTGIEFFYCPKPRT